ncbi:uncharacterized protein [Penaeus vannamei]|uniref:uncharacterized protein n=1 Tax=Penaeus vannamei TaxID=6689 RepID=UPI00387FA90D
MVPSWLYPLLLVTSCCTNIQAKRLYTWPWESVDNWTPLDLLKWGHTVAPRTPDCLDSAPIQTGDGSTDTMTVTWCRMTGSQCNLLCHGVRHSFYHVTNDTCVCTKESQGNSSAVDGTLELAICWDYYHLGYTVPGRYETEMKDLPCDTEDRGMCEGSLFHGSSILLSNMTQSDPDPAFVSMINDLSPYIFPPTPFYTSVDGLIEIHFEQPVLVHGVSIYGEADSQFAVSSFQIYYAYDRSEVYNVTNFVDYHYSEEEYGEVTTLYTGFVPPDITTKFSNGTTTTTTTTSTTTSTTTTTTTTTRPPGTTTTAPSYEFPDPPLVMHHQLRPFVATSVKIKLLETPVQLKLDMWGCKYDPEVDAGHAVSKHYGCYWFRTDQLTGSSVKSGFNVAEYARYYSKIELVHDLYLTSIIEDPPVGKATSADHCRKKLSCQLLKTLLVNSGRRYECKKKEIEDEMKKRLGAKIEDEAKDDHDDCVRITKNRIDNCTQYIEYNFHKVCPDETYDLYKWAYEHFVDALEKCPGNVQDEIADIRTVTSKCKNEEPGPYTPAFAYHQRHLDVDCKTTFVDLAKGLYPNQTFNFYQAMPQVGGGERLVVGRNITLSCLCPMKTATPNNNDYVMCLPDFTYYYQSFLGCWDRECNTSLLLPVPALGSWNWLGGRALTNTKITYTCNTWALFKDLWIPSLTTRCKCDETWSLASLPECVNVSTTPVPPTTTTTIFSTTSSTMSTTSTATIEPTTTNITFTTTNITTTTDDVTESTTNTTFTTDDVTDSTTNTTFTTNNVTATTTDTTDITQTTEKEITGTASEGKFNFFLSLFTLT